jgi:hypothetical protein
VLGKNPSLVEKLSGRTGRREYNRLGALQLARKIHSEEDINASFPLMKTLILFDTRKGRTRKCARLVSTNS